MHVLFPGTEAVTHAGNLRLYLCKNEPSGSPFAPADIIAPTDNTVAYLEKNAQARKP